MPKTKKNNKKKASKATKRNRPVKKQAVAKAIGKITHYYSNIDVAVVKLLAPLKNGDKIRIIGGKETDFKQKVSSMQVEHEQVKSAKKGSLIGLKVAEKVHEGYRVFKA